MTKSLNPPKSIWSEDPDFPHADWVFLVAQGDVSAGYWDWVLSEREAADLETSHLAGCPYVGEEVPPADDDSADFPRSDWLYEVENNDTRLGFAAWQAHQREAARMDAQPKRSLRPPRP